MIVAEEPTKDNIQQLINKMPIGITPIERVILYNDGTVQTLLSVLFGVPVNVFVLSQKTLPNIGIIRWTKLVTSPSGSNKEIVACLAVSVIPFKTNPEGFITAINEQKMGIGQILKATGLKQERDIFDLYVDDNIIARNYCISGDVNITITETFPREAIKKASEMI